MRAAAITGAADSIGVNAVSLGWIDTAVTGRALAELPGAEVVRTKAGGAYILGRLARSEEAADAIASLLSDTASFVTDTESIVGGGVLCSR